jgi:hypothetical protein
VADPIASTTVALSTLLEHTQKQLEILESMRTRPDVDLHGLMRTSFELTLKGMKTSVASLANDAALSSEVKERIAAFVAAVDRYESASVRVGQHLIAMSAGWQCPKCKSDVARTAALSGVGLGKGFVKLELVCAECGARSVPAPVGRKVFEEKFGHLVNASWNPEQCGFVWDHR